MGGRVPYIHNVPSTAEVLAAQPRTFTTNRKARGSPTVGEKTEVADAHEPFRQDMQKEASQELGGS